MSADNETVAIHIVFKIQYLPHDVSAGNPDVLIASLDCNAADNVNKDLCLQLGVNGVPSIIIVKVGEFWLVNSVDIDTDVWLVNNLDILIGQYSSIFYIKDGVKVGEHGGKRDLETLTEMVDRYLHPENYKESEMDLEEGSPTTSSETTTWCY